MNRHLSPEREDSACGPAGAPGPAARAPLSVALASVGAATLTVQILLLRELMTAWRGNEMSFGIVMAVWLLTGGIGSAAYFLVAGRIAPTRASLARWLIVLGAMAPAALLLSRALRGAMGLTTGEVAGFLPLVVASFLSLAPFTVAAGLTFALSTSIVHAESNSKIAAGRVYLMEAVGAACAGLLVSFLLLPRFDPVSISLTVTLVACAVSVWLLVALPRSGRGPSALLALAIGLAVASAFMIGPAGSRLDNASVGAQWRDVGFVAQTNSIYGRIVATSMGSQKSIYESGVLAASVPDRMAAEETVHLPLLSHPKPSRVLLLGGGLGGALLEVLKHPSVSAVDYVELDPELIRTARTAFGDAMTGGFNDSRVKVHFSDARFFVKRVEVPYDVVVVGVPDPTTAQLNRFYTAEFMEEVDRALTDGGVVGFSVQSAENYIGTELATLLACLKTTAESVFPAVAVYPGDPCHIIASRSGGSFTRDADELSERVRERGLDVAYVRDYYLADRLSPERVAGLDAALAEAPSLLNTDLRPTACYLSMVLWNRQFSGAPGLLPTARRYLTESNALLAAIALGLILAAHSIAGGRTHRSLSRAVVAIVFLVGATEISLELTALLAFQSLYGYVYQELALIVAAFMGGIALGSWLGARAAARGAGVRSFAALQLALCAVPLALAATLVRMAALPPHHLRTWAMFFPVVVVGAALLAGLQFPLAAVLVSGGHRSIDVGAQGGRLYGADLLGAAVGAIGTAVFLLPMLGIPGAMRVLAVANAAALVSLLPYVVSVTRGRDG